MEIQRQNGTLSIRGLQDLNAANARDFRNEAGAAIAPDLERIDIDLSDVRSVDCRGVGALVSLYQNANKVNRNGGVALRLLNPPPPVRQMFELTRTHRLFEIISSSSPSSAP